MKKQDVVSMLREIKRDNGVDGIDDLTGRRIDNVIRLVIENRSNVVDTGELYMGITPDAGVELGYKYSNKAIMSIDMRCIYTVDSLLEVSKERLYNIFYDTVGRQQLRDTVTPKQLQAAF